MTARYMDSVPILGKQWTIRGYIWRMEPPRTTPPSVIDIDTCKYVGKMPDGGLLLATPAPRPPDPQDLEKLGFSRHTPVWPWAVRMYNGEDEKAPLAVLDDTGRYFQLESFGVSIQDETRDEAMDATGDRHPVICEFRVGQTSGALRICPE